MASTIIVSYSEIDTARQCLFKHELAYKERWQSPTTSPALSRGTAWHSVMESHYRALWELQKDGREVDFKALRSIVADVKRLWLYDERTGSQTEDQGLLEWMYDGYVEYWGTDSMWKVRAVEHAPVIPLWNERGNRSRFRLKLKIDLVVTDVEFRRLVLVDHKSGKDLPKQKELDILDQFSLYTAAMRRLGKPVFGSIHNAARTQRNKDQVKHPQPLPERFKRTHLYHTDTELDAILLDAYRWAKLAWSFKIGEAPRSPNPDTCRWRCDFTEPCLAGRKGMDHREMLKDLGYVQNFERH